MALHRMSAPDSCADVQALSIQEIPLPDDCESSPQ